MAIFTTSVTSRETEVGLVTSAGSLPVTTTKGGIAAGAGLCAKKYPLPSFSMSARQAG
ncbi:hypothetical protein D3C85_1453160 [compost metagenome]